MDEKSEPRVYTMTEVAASSMLQKADEQLEMVADLLEDKIIEDPLDMKVISYLCDSFSCNYHIRKTLKTNLNYNLIEDEKTKKNVVILNETDILILENAVLSFAITKKELLKLNYSLALH